MDANSQYDTYGEDQELYTQPKPKTVIKTIKLKLRVGSEIEVYSKSQDQWIAGKIVRIKSKLICVEYGKMQKWLPSTTKEIRARTPNTSKSQEQKSDHNQLQSDEMNNPSPKTCKNSIAFKEQNPVKINLRIGAPVEVYSVSQNAWINGKVTGIKNDFVKIAYGQNFTFQKWLGADSNHYRAKLDMVDAAFRRKQTAESLKQLGLHPIESQTDEYTIDNSEASIGTHFPDVSESPLQNNRKNNRPPPPVPQHLIGAYITRSLRREQYEKDSFESIRGSNDKRGDLKIKVHGALQLRNNANYCELIIGNHTLKTKKCSSSENPVWKEILKWSNFRPHVGKTGVIRIYNKSAILGEKFIGSAEFELPLVFKEKEKMTIDVCDGKNKISGIVVLEQCVVMKGQ